MEHELRVDGEVLRQPEGLRFILSIICKFLAQPNKHPIKPAQDIRPIVNLGLKDGNTRHEDGSRLLIERICDFWAGAFSPVASNCGNPQPELAARMLIVSDKLNEATRARLNWLRVLTDNLKVDGGGSFGSNGAHFPLRGLANTNFCLADGGRFFISRNGRADQAADF